MKTILALLALLITAVADDAYWKELPAPKTRQLEFAIQKCAQLERNYIFVVLHHSGFGADSKHAKGFLGHGVENILRKEFVCMVADEEDASLTEKLSKTAYESFLAGESIYLALAPDGTRLTDGIFRFDRGVQAIKAIRAIR